MSENKIESVDGFNGHLQQLGDIINYLDGLQMGEVWKFDKGEEQELKNNFIVLNDNQIIKNIEVIKNITRNNSVSGLLFFIFNSTIIWSETNRNAE